MICVWFLMGMGVFFLGPLPVNPRPFFSPPQESRETDKEPPVASADRERLRVAARRFLEGDQESGQFLAAAGAPAIAAIEDLFSEPAAEKDLQSLIETILRNALLRSLTEEEGLVYHGQFDSLRGLGSRGARRLLAIFRDENEGPEIRARAANALADVGDASLLPDLRKVLEDFLTEAWVEDAAGFLMARLGDRSYVDRLIQGAHEVISQVTTTRNLPSILAGHTTLAEVYYRTEDYSQAIKHYEQKQAILNDLSGRLRKELRGGLEREMALLHYNKACSLSLAARIDEAFQSLEQALPHSEVTLAMVAADGDLRGLRADPRYEAWRQKMEEQLKEIEPASP